MTNFLDWTPLLVAMIALAGSLYTARMSKRESESRASRDDFEVLNGIIEAQTKRIDNLKIEMSEMRATYEEQINLLQVEIAELKKENSYLRRVIRGNDKSPD